MRIALITIFANLFLFNFILNSFAQDYNQWHLPEGAVARLGKGEINDIQYSPDGTRLAVASAIGVWLYDAATYQELVLLTGDVDPVKSVIFSPDGRTLASKSGQGPIRLWDARTGQRKRIITGHTIVRPTGDSISFSPDGLTLATGNHDGTIRLWDVTTGAHLRTFTGQTESVSIVLFSPDGRTLASATWDGNIHLWNMVTGAYKRILAGHTSFITDISFSPDGRTLASGSTDETIRLWDTLTGANKHTLTVGKYRYVNRVSFSPNGRTLVGGGYQAIYFWNPVTGQLEKTIRGHSGRINGVSFSPNGAVLASSDESEIHFWDGGTKQHIKSITGHRGSILSLTFSPNGQMIANQSSDKIYLWDAVTGARLNTLTGDTSGRYYYSVAFSPDGRTLAAGGSTARSDSHSPIDLWDTVTGAHLRSLMGSTVSVYSIAYSPDGRTLASGGHDGTARLWDVVTGARLHTLAGHADRVNSVAFSQNGQILASGSGDGTIRFWDVRTGNHMRTLVGHRQWVDSVAFSPDGRIFASTGSGETRLWNAVTGIHLQTLTGHRGNNIVFSPDGQTLASGTTDGALYLWDVAAGQQKKTFKGHTDWAYSVAFSPDGQTLASGSYDGTILLWRLMPSRAITSRVLVAAVNRPPMLWVDGGAIYALVGANVQRFAQGVDNAMNLAVDATNSKVYWTEKTGESAGTINSANLNGTGVTELTSILAVPMGIAVDAAGSKLYWSNSRGRIQRANLNGSGIQNVLENLSGSPMDIALSGGNVYWTQDNGSVRFANLNGQKIVRDISTGTDTPGSLVIGGGKVYWTEKRNETYGTLNSANLNGSGATQLISVLAAPMGIAVDSAESKLYWTDAVGRLHRSNLDGTGIQKVVEGLGSLGELVLSNSISAPAPGTLSIPSTSDSKDDFNYDVNRDGTVDNTDAGLVADALGTIGGRSDVNKDGTVNFLDLLLVLDNRDDAAGAPTVLGMKLSAAQIDIIKEQIDLLIATNDRSPAAIKTLIYLQQLIVTARPEKTQLFANYPNPFNPETWIPYELATDTDVRITIYNAHGVVVRTLQLGQQPTGYYTDRERAAYWNGKNALGEPVASGIYFYTLTAGDFTATRKMLIVK